MEPASAGMTPTPEVIRDLIEKVEAGSGRDVELDRELEALWWPSDRPQWTSDAFLAKCTSSTDAALLLSSQLLPGWQVEQVTWEPVLGGEVFASIGNFGEGEAYRMGLSKPCKSAPRALLSATLRALLATMSTSTCDDGGI